MLPFWIYALGVCFGLGLLHGLIPDEHTWPITFSYSVGTTTGKGGLLSGLFFASAFTLQRAMMAQLVSFAFASFLILTDALNGPVYITVGVAMAIAGYLILGEHLPHWHPLMWISKHDKEKHGDRIPTHWCVIHGFIAGFGVDTGLFTTFIYLVAVPAVPVYIGFLPGALFGLGTLLVLLFIGLFFGGALQLAKRFGAERIKLFGRRVGARGLLFGGVAFIIAGLLYNTNIPNYVPFDFGSFIVLFFMIAIIVPVMIYTWREVRKMPVRTSEFSSKAASQTPTTM